MIVSRQPIQFTLEHLQESSRPSCTCIRGVIYVLKVLSWNPIHIVFDLLRLYSSKAEGCTLGPTGQI